MKIPLPQQTEVATTSSWAAWGAHETWGAHENWGAHEKGPEVQARYQWAGALFCDSAAKLLISAFDYRDRRINADRRD